MSNDIRFTVVMPGYSSAYSSTPSIHVIDKSSMVGNKTLCGKRVNFDKWRVKGFDEKLNLVDCKVCLRKMFQNETSP